MCEFKRTPRTRYDDVHFGTGANAPSCIIRVQIECDDSFCDGDIEVKIVDQETGEDLTDFRPVSCTGAEARHDLPMTIQCPLQFRRAKAVFRCCDSEREGAIQPIWVRCP